MTTGPFECAAACHCQRAGDTPWSPSPAVEDETWRGRPFTWPGLPRTWGMDPAVEDEWRHDPEAWPVRRTS